MVLLTSWVIWNEPNARIFRGTARSMTQVFGAVKDLLAELVEAGYGCLASVLRELE
jgi:hypothetical protein